MQCFAVLFCFFWWIICSITSRDTICCPFSWCQTSEQSDQPASLLFGLFVCRFLPSSLVSMVVFIWVHFSLFCNVCWSAAFSSALFGAVTSVVFSSCCSSCTRWEASGFWTSSSSSGAFTSFVHTLALSSSVSQWRMSWSSLCLAAGCSRSFWASMSCCCCCWSFSVFSVCCCCSRHQSFFETAFLSLPGLSSARSVWEAFAHQVGSSSHWSATRLLFCCCSLLLV